MIRTNSRLIHPRSNKISCFFHPCLASSGRRSDRHRKMIMRDTPRWYPFEGVACMCFCLCCDCASQHRGNNESVIVRLNGALAVPRSWRGGLRAIGSDRPVTGTENDNGPTGGFGDETFRTRRLSAVARMTKTWTVSGFTGLLVLVPVTVCATITYVNSNEDPSRCNDRSNNNHSSNSKQFYKWSIRTLVAFDDFAIDFITWDFIVREFIHTA